MNTTWVDDHKLRIFYEDNDTKPRIVAQDISSILEYSDPSSLLRIVDEKDISKEIVPVIGGNRRMSLITQAGMASIAERSTKFEAKKLAGWIDQEIKIQHARDMADKLSNDMSKNESKSYIEELIRGLTDISGHGQTLKPSKHSIVVNYNVHFHPAEQGDYDCL
jgi:prophage antirepressor-like protein